MKNSIGLPVQYSTLKILGVQANLWVNAVDGFQMHDLLAKAARPYAYLYPFLELGLGLGYLSRWQPAFVYGATIILMLFGAIGVLLALKKGLDLECACMGTVLKVPLSTVALLEDFGMAAMAMAMLLMTV